MFVRQRIYYEKETGTIVQITGNYQDSGLRQEPTVQEDFYNYSALKERVPETLEVLTLEKGEYENEFVNATTIRVDVKTKKLVFDYIPIVEKEMEQKKSLEKRVDMLESAINDILLGGM
ncbi:Uncharacterised protein [Streptococcus pneumoniae]|uniref:hypothetical protein n=1 Tax=Bacilli TaxID=91061 RepID=UPI0005E6A778|nr:MULTISPECIES: hypothetical protein [Bacilli]CKE75757.1 Uncharacterised protein [Streptococcus pneumoniae]CKE78373.1 Uncharacterised protein [Streptococcus pneumoniae]CKE87963.1 Uncharacterised protein [Streptococcus pneumoniae]CKF08527.1 Uncharacterised protein [Streptococcus pneumoniae]CKF17490.1 Uncharacterised protein [Streptococcus pneumoniae]